MLIYMNSFTNDDLIEIILVVLFTLLLFEMLCPTIEDIKRFINKYIKK